MNTDANHLPELTERQEKILTLIVKEYTNRSEPVGSRLLADQYLGSISSATIRNEMARLEELGLLAAPHTSAGRIPTEAGYRYFVKRLLSVAEQELPDVEKRLIAEQFERTPGDMDAWMRMAVNTLARTTRSAALVTPPRSTLSRFKHLALISTHGRMVMMVLVLQSGDVRQQMLTLTEGLNQEQLTAIANKFNATYTGMTADQLRTAAAQDSVLEREILELIADTLEDFDQTPQQLMYRDGLSDMLVEFQDTEGAQQAVRVIEGQSGLEPIISTIHNQAIGEVRVMIAGEGRWDQIRHLGMVWSRYGVRGKAVGTLIIVGPTRMRYGRAISAAGYVAGLMSNLMIEAYGNPDEDEG
ncbi:MAG: heat-inducible transcription repressor HrcA [Anaerolineae bacterium]|nr:heat-inducible transcription repressor HrcA [Anaerolineae bacterium]